MRKRNPNERTTFVVRLRGAHRPWADELDAPGAIRAYRDALDHGLSKDRLVIHRTGDLNDELPPDRYPWGCTWWAEPKTKEKA